MKLAFSLLFWSTVGVVTMAASSPGVLNFCNRGFCYTKKEPISSTGRKQNSGLNFCTDSGGHVRDCELFEILGTGADELEAVECASSSCRRMQGDIMRSSESDTQVYASLDGEVIDLDNDDDDVGEEHMRSRSWKEKPKRGRCYDNSLAYEFDCNLVEILDEGLVLIEDLRAGGIFAAQPKSGFSTREGKNQQAPRTPEVVMGSGATGPDPTEDFRTNVSLNLEGL